MNPQIYISVHTFHECKKKLFRAEKKTNGVCVCVCRITRKTPIIKLMPEFEKPTKHAVVDNELESSFKSGVVDDVLFFLFVLFLSLSMRYKQNTTKLNNGTKLIQLNSNNFSCLDRLLQKRNKKKFTIYVLAHKIVCVCVCAADCFVLLLKCYAHSAKRGNGRVTLKHDTHTHRVRVQKKKHTYKNPD